MRYLILILLLQGVAMLPHAAGATPTPTTETLTVAVDFQTGTRVRFLQPAEAMLVLSKEDRFLRSLSPFDRSARLKTSRPISQAEFIQFVTNCTRAWKPSEQIQISNTLQTIASEIAPYRMVFPAEILLIQTNGKEEGRAAYCRGNAMILPTNELQQPPGKFHDLLLHELFHIYSSFHPEKTAALYALLGFTSCTPITLPDDLAKLKITNPDAPQINAVISLKQKGRTAPFAPVLLSTVPRYPEERGGEFFDYLSFRLMEVKPTQGGYDVVLNNQGLANLIDPDEVPDYLEQVGRNTSYILHPEEILAENFVLLVKGKPHPPSPAILAKLRSVLVPTVSSTPQQP